MRKAAPTGSSTSAHIRAPGCAPGSNLSGERALIRAYDAATANRLEAMETPLFAQYEFVPIARQDLVRTESGGLNAGWSLIVGPLLAPAEKVTIHLRLVCFSGPEPT